MYEWSDFYYKWSFKKRLPKSFQLPEYSVEEKIGKTPKTIKYKSYSPRTTTKVVGSQMNSGGTSTSNVGSSRGGY